MIIQEKSIPHIFRNKYLRDQGGAVMVGGSGGGTVTTVGGDYLPANLYESETYKVDYNTEFLKNLKANQNFEVVGDTILNNLTVNGDSNLKNTNIDGDINLTGTIYVNGEEFKGGDSKGGYSSYGTRHKQVSGVDGGAEIVIDMGGSDFAEGTIRIYAAYTNSYLEDPTTDYSAVYNVMIDSYSYSEDTNIAMGSGSGASNKFYKKIQDGKVYIYLPIPYGYIKSIGAHFSTFNDDKRLEEGTENKVVQLNRIHNSTADSSGYIGNFSELPVYTMESKVNDLNDRIDSALGELEYSEYYGSEPTVFYRQIFFELGKFGTGYPIDPTDDEYDKVGAIYGYVEIMDRYGGYDVCLLHIPYTIKKSDSNASGHEYYDCFIGDCSVVGGYYDWDIYCKWVYSNSSVRYLTGRQIAICLNAQSNTIDRIRARFYDMREDNSGRIILPAIFETSISHDEEYDPQKYWYSGKSFSYNPRYLSNYEGNLNVQGNTVLSNFYEGYGGTIIDTHYETFGGSSGNAPQYGIQLESNGYGYSTGSKSYITIQGNTGIQMGCGDFSLSSEGGHTLSSDYWDGYQIDGSKISTHNDTFTKEETYSKAQLDTWKDETEWYLNNRVDSWCIPFTERLNNVEEQLDNIEILLDSILGYQTNTYLEETLDEILYQ